MEGNSGGAECAQSANRGAGYSPATASQLSSLSEGPQRMLVSTSALSVTLCRTIPRFSCRKPSHFIFFLKLCNQQEHFSQCSAKEGLAETALAIAAVASQELVLAPRENHTEISCLTLGWVFLLADSQLVAKAEALNYIWQNQQAFGFYEDRKFASSRIFQRQNSTHEQHSKAAKMRGMRLWSRILKVINSFSPTRLSKGRWWDWSVSRSERKGNEKAEAEISMTGSTRTLPSQPVKSDKTKKLATSWRRTSRCVQFRLRFRGKLF